jgi:hypothetical protein
MKYGFEDLSVVEASIGRTIMNEMNALLTGDKICLMAMATMFGFFMFGLWLEARKALRKVSEHEHAAILRHCEAEYRRMLKRREARERLSEMRAELALVSAKAAPVAERGLGPEHISRILDRLCGLAPELDSEWSTVPELHFVQGGARTPQQFVTREPVMNTAIHDRRQRRHG